MFALEEETFTDAYYWNCSLPSIPRELWWACKTGCAISNDSLLFLCQGSNEQLDNERQDATWSPLKHRNFSHVSPEKFTLDRFPAFWAQAGGAAAITQRCFFRGSWDGNSGNIQGGHCIPGAPGVIPGLRCPSHHVPSLAAGWQPNKGGALRPHTAVVPPMTPPWGGCRRQPLTATPSSERGPAERRQNWVSQKRRAPVPAPPPPRSRPQRPARAKRRARASPQGCGAAAEGPRGSGGCPPSAFPLPLPSRCSNFLKEQRRHLPGFPALTAAAPDNDHARKCLMSARRPRPTGTVRAAPGPLLSPRPNAPHEKGGKGRVLLAPLRTWRSPTPLSSLLRSHRPLARRHRIDAAPLRLLPSALTPGHGSSPQRPGSHSPPSMALPLSPQALIPLP